MKTMKGPGLFLAQSAQDAAPHNSLDGIARWAKDYGYKGTQMPSWDPRVFDLDKAYDSETDCDEVRGRLADIGIAITELSTHFQGQMVSVHPAYDALFDGQVPAEVRGNPEKRRLERAGRDRSLGHGQVDFRAVFSRLAAHDYAGWAVYEWECCLEHPEVAARNGSKFIAEHIIEVTDRVFDDFATTNADPVTDRALLGIRG